MKLLLVRHAAAVPRGTAGVSDDERPLTSSGKIKFRAAASGLTRVVRRPDVLLTSPLSRARATAEIVARAFRHLEPRLEPALADESVDGVLLVLNAQAIGATVALIGHEPGLSALLARLVGAARGPQVVFDKGGAALVDLSDGPTGDGRLLWFLPSRILGLLALDRRRTSLRPDADGAPEHGAAGRARQ
jgi:phosphohistidine phosphatase